MERTLKKYGVTLEQHRNYKWKPAPGELAEAKRRHERAFKDSKKLAKENETGDLIEALSSSSGWFQDHFGAPSSYNSFDFRTARQADILLGHSGYVPWGYFRHVGLFDPDYRWIGRPIRDSIPGEGVRLAPYSDYLKYEELWGQWVPSASDTEAWLILYFASLQYGKPYSYDILNKWRTDRYYCSSYVWRAYLEGTFGWADLDSNGGWAVFPDDISASWDTYIFHVGM